MRDRATLIMAIIVLWLALSTSVALAQGDEVYVAPDGKGSGCTRQTPCSLNQGLQEAQPGDDVILLDGTYTQRTRTVRSGRSDARITIRPLNRRRAIIKWPGSHQFARLIDITHSYITLKGIRFDGSGRSWDSIRVLGDGSGSRGVIIEDVHLYNAGHAGIMLFNTRDVIVRHSLFEDTGQYDDSGECMYLTSASGGQPVVGAKIYGNICRNTVNNFVDYKSQARDINVHHNIFEKHGKNILGYGGDGLIRSEGSNSSSGNVFENNIVRNSKDEASYLIRLSSNRVDVRGNVFSDLKGGTLIDDRTTASARIENNTFCNTPTRRPGGFGPNNYNAPKAECDLETERILAPPEFVECEIGARGPDILITRWKMGHPPLSAVKSSAFTVYVDGAEQKNTTTVVFGDTETHTVLSTGATSQSQIDMTLAGAAAENSAFIGGMGSDGINGVSAAKSRTTCRNLLDNGDDNGEPAPPPPPEKTKPPYYLNAGGDKYVDNQGRVWVADRTYSDRGYGYSDGSISTTTKPIAGTDDMALYQAWRWGDTTYRFAVPDKGPYDIELHFVETSYTHAGSRIFDIAIENQTVLDDYDILAHGNQDTAVSVTIEDIEADGDTLDIAFAAVSSTPRIAAIAIRRAEQKPLEPRRAVLAAVADTYICELPACLSAAAALGESIIMAVRENPVNAHRAYMTFDLSAVPWRMAKATLRVEVLNFMSDVTIKAFRVAPESWQENALTWENAPRLMEEIDSTVVSGFGVMEFDLTPILGTLTPETQALTVALVEDAETDLGVTFAAREANRYVPTLTLIEHVNERSP